MKLGPNERCPCGSGAKYKKCCRPIVEGQRPVTPEALMRSRYTAYAVGAVEHLMRSTHPSGPHARSDARAWRAELAEHCAAVVAVSLSVLSSTTQGDVGHVHFRAKMRGPQGDYTIEERSRFLREQGAWRYHSDDTLHP